jgi:hypothetical protein
MLLQLRPDLVDGREDLRDVGADEHAHVRRAEPTELLQDLRHGPRVVLGVAERILSGPADVGADEDAVGEGVGDARRDRRRRWGGRGA